MSDNVTAIVALGLIVLLAGWAFWLMGRNG